jgi:prevent-host-death family protein
MTEMPVTKGRGTLGRLIDQIRESGEPIYFTRHGRPVAVLVDVDSYRRLVEVADNQWEPGSSPLTAEELIDGLQEADKLLRALVKRAAPTRGT